MPLFKRAKAPEIPYDPARQTPAVRCSICTGEMTAGFLEDGVFHDWMRVDRAGLADFCRRVGVREEDLKRIY